MSQFAERIRERVRELFPERQVYVRSGGDSRYFTLNSLTQVTSVLGVTGVLVVTAISFLLVGQNTTGQSFVADMGRLESEFAQKMAATQQTMIDTTAAYQRQINELSANLESSRSKTLAEREEAQKRLDRLTSNLAAATAQLQDAETRTTQEQAQITQLEAQIALTLADEKRVEVVVSSENEAQLNILREKREGLQKQLAAELRDKSDLQSKYSAQVDILKTEVGQMRTARDELTLKLDQADIARQKAESEAMQLSQNLNNLQTSIAAQQSHTSALEQELSSLTAELNSTRLQQQEQLKPVEFVEETVDPAKQDILEKRVADLLVIEDGLIGQLEKSTKHDLAFVERVIRNTGLDVDTLMDSLDSESISIGGPYLDLSNIRKVSHKTPSRPKVNERVNNLNFLLSKLSWLEIALKSMPLATPVDNARMTSGFGGRTDPFTKTSAFHSGLDFAGARGTEIRTTGPGTVIFAGRRSSYGKFIEIDHGHGLQTRYAHLSSLEVETGDKVNYQQIIGKMGSSGRSTGVHLHYEVTFNEEFFDPKQFIEAGRDVFKVKNQVTKPVKKPSSGR